MCVPAAGSSVLLVDQWIETGGTMKAAIQLVEKLGATVVGLSVNKLTVTVLCKSLELPFFIFC